MICYPFSSAELKLASAEFGCFYMLHARICHQKRGKWRHKATLHQINDMGKNLNFKEIYGWGGRILIFSKII